MLHFSFFGLNIIDEGGITNNRLFIWSDKKYDIVKNIGGEKILEKKFWKCNICKKTFTIEEFKKTWDYSGPNCPNQDCNNGGIFLFKKNNKKHLK